MSPGASAAAGGDSGQGLTRRFGDFTAVDHVNPKIERGEIFGFLGANGCGKTTTMKMLTGLLPPGAGQAALLGQRVDAHDLGIRQRLSLAVAVVHEPRLLILDKPTSGVDPIARDEFRTLLGELSRDQGVTIFILTQFMNEAACCNRISLTHAGRVLASGMPHANPVAGVAPERAQATRMPPRFGLRRLLGRAWRETLELRRDPTRLTFALLGSVLLMFMLGYGITPDIEDLRFAAFDRDSSPESRAYVQRFAGRRYLVDAAECAAGGSSEKARGGRKRPLPGRVPRAGDPPVVQSAA